MRHLRVGDLIWCEGEENTTVEDTTDDPREATCLECLKHAASYGAAAAMRYAAVESAISGCPRCTRPPLRVVP